MLALTRDRWRDVGGRAAVAGAGARSRASSERQGGGARSSMRRRSGAGRRRARAQRLAASGAVAVWRRASRGRRTATTSDSESHGGAKAAGRPTPATTITMWTRAATQTQSERLVKAYNASHKNQVELTVIPTDNYQARVAAAAGGKNLPDVFASDVIYAPNYTSQGLYLDITDRIDALDVQGQPGARAHAARHVRGRASTRCRTRSTSRCSSGTRTSTRRPASTPRSRRPR